MKLLILLSVLAVGELVFLIFLKNSILTSLYSAYGAQELTLYHDGKEAVFTRDCNELANCGEGWNNNEGKGYRMHGM